MSIYERGELRLYFEEHGSGSPLLLIAPGGMRSAVGAWQRTPWNPITQLGRTHRVIAMDQRNAGASWGPVGADTGWSTYTGDQLALLDHLGVDRFAVLGMCIGGSYILNLLRHAADRVAAAVLLQPIGLHDNRDAFYEMFDGWRAEIAAGHPEAGDGDWDGFRANMYGGEELHFSVPTADIAGFGAPMLVLLGDDLFHPQVASRAIVATAPNATLVQRWKEPVDQPAARLAVEQFLSTHWP